MKLAKAFLILSCSFVLAACGGGSGAGDSPFGNGSGGSGGSGGGGTGGGGSTASGVITLSLQDTGGTTLSPPSLTGSQNAVAVVRLVDSSGAAVSNTLVTVTGSGLQLTPATGQTLTDATGVAKVQVRASDPFASGATTIAATAKVGANVLNASLDVALG